MLFAKFLYANGLAAAPATCAVPEDSRHTQLLLFSLLQLFVIFLLKLPFFLFPGGFAISLQSLIDKIHICV